MIFIKPQSLGAFFVTIIFVFKDQQDQQLKSVRVISLRQQRGHFGAVHLAHKEIYNLFNLSRNLIKSDYHRELRKGAFTSWNRAVGI
ncbi:MAG: hypothetical protein ACJAZT_001689 [Gammaproteobacteria bacterium]